jgi:hypothetical protein
MTIGVDFMAGSLPPPAAWKASPQDRSRRTCPRPYDEARAIDEGAGRELGPGRVVATVAVDSGLKYLAGDLFETAR